jgi:DNA-binding CsgD family transcriptional regulator
VQPALRNVGPVTSGYFSSGQASLLCPVMVGRERELEVLRGAWRLAGRMLVIRGTAGIGKSRLVREFASGVSKAGGTVLTGRCSPTATEVPLRPLREALLSAARNGLRPSADLAPFLPVLGALVPDWGGTVGSATDRSTVVLAEGLLRLAAYWSTPHAPTLLVLEDVHWSDPETLMVIEYLADNLAGQRVLVVATVREGEPGAGTDVIARLEARRAVTDVWVRALDADESGAVLRECLGVAAAPPDLVDAVVSRSDGIPFFIEELLATALADPTGRSVPASIGAALEVRLASLPDGAAQFLRYAAVLGRQFDWHVVAAALRCPPEDGIGRLRDATRAQLIDADGGGFRFRHALTVDAVHGALLPEERQAICVRLSETLEAIHPDLEGELCQLAANLAEEAGQHGHAADLWLEAARRARREGSLGSAEALALRARGDRPVESDRVLLSTWALSGQPLRALEAGDRILSLELDPALQMEVRFDLVDAMIDAGRWEDAENHLETLRGAPESTPSDAARRAIGEAEVALAHNDRTQALTYARAALAEAQAAGLPEVTCRALWLIGRVERGRDTAAASAAFDEAYRYASHHGLALYRTRALMELGTIDMFETLATGRLEEARREALTMGALSTAAMVDLQLAATFSCRGQAALTLAAAARCEEVSRRFGLASLPMSLALQGVAHGFAGNRVAMDVAVARARALAGDRDTVEMITLGNGAALCHLGEGQIPDAIAALDGAMEVLRAAGGGAHPFPGRWALVRTVLDDGGAEARAECRVLDLDTPMSRATLGAADAVAAGRLGGDAESVFAVADEALSRFQGGFLRSLARLLVAPCAHRDGWGEPAAWLRESLANFEDLELHNFAGQCRLALRAMDEAVPRRARPQGAGVPGPLAAQGVTPREVEVMALVVAGRSNREIAEALQLSVRTVEKHVERLLMKTGCPRSGLGRLAETVGVEPAG